jgi:hypothetical protein
LSELILQQLKRQHSAEPLNKDAVKEGRKPSKSATPSAASTPKIGNDLSTTPPVFPSATAPPLLKTTIDSPAGGASFVGSPMKRQRASLAGTDADNANARLGSALTGNIGEILGSAGNPSVPAKSAGDNGMHHFGGAIVKKEAADEEL